MQENEPKQIPGNGEYTGAWSHHEIKDAFESQNTHNAYNAAVQYSNAATMWDQGVETFARSVISSISQAWEGSAADAAKDAIKRYTDAARNLEPMLTQLSNKITESAAAIVDTRNAIPGYADHSWTANVWPPRAAEEERSRNEAEQSARDAMNNIYVSRFAGYDAQVPVLPSGVNPTQQSDAPVFNPGTSPTVDSSFSPSSPGSPGSPDDPGSPSAPTDQAQDVPTADELMQQPNANAPATKPTGYDPTATDTGTPTPTSPGTTPASTVPTSTLSPSTPHTPNSVVPGSPESRAPRPGSSVPGATSPNVNASAVNPSAVSRAGIGTPGMVPGMGGAGRGKSDEESTHKTPDYLINQENTAELIGELPRTIPAGVIGRDPQYVGLSTDDDESAEASQTTESTEI
ncbi:WXG100 family type VII secretion target [Nocardia gamkensis]|uniref:Uncharacterized protein n=1 Tax=Nocardia gamkensis TaxID=352869 RepID=A0A7X6L4U3_9NOCA|nr:WXG100 family type VII secretion target [Nocardia gamkensis]NKY27755.1 hypothetical protein [Nocardia gamkensis]NQE67392.1 Mucin-2 [Nocardia gamkensis]